MLSKNCINSGISICLTYDIYDISEELRLATCSSIVCAIILSISSPYIENVYARNLLYL